MINPKLLTKENGFEEGVVVEAVRSNGSSDYFRLISDGVHTKTGTFHYFETDNGTKQTHWYESFKPLTGPMSIWNHAPKDADVLHFFGNGNIEWLRGTVDGWKMNHGYEDLIERPFWAQPIAAKE